MNDPFKYVVNGVIAISLLTLSCTSHQKEKKEESRKKELPAIEEAITENSLYAKYGFTRLSDYGFFKGEISELVPGKNVHSYSINSPLFSDYAKKKRFIYLPEGKKISPKKTEVLDFPVGSVLIKNFFYSDEQLEEEKGRIIETRLLIREEKGWKALPYIWNEAQSEAYLEITGGLTSLSLKEHAKPVIYSIPTMTECKSCHEKNGEIELIGPSLRQLNKKVLSDGEKVNQLVLMKERGWISEDFDMNEIEALPDYTDPNSGSLEGRARAYLEINCAHCHRESGPAKNSGLDLTYHNDNPYSLGINKPPIAAGKGSGGLRFDVVKGEPESSILVYRMESEDPAIMMPEIGRSMVHKEGVELVRDWITSLE